MSASYKMNNLVEEQKKNYNSMQDNKGKDNNAFEPDAENGKVSIPGTLQDTDARLHPLNDDGDDDDDEEGDDTNCCSSMVGIFQQRLSDFLDKNGNIITKAFCIVLLIAFFVYFSFAMHHEFGSEESWRLLVCTALGVLILGNNILSKILKRFKSEEEKTESKFWKKIETFFVKIRLNLILQLLLLVGFIVLISVDIAPNQPHNLVSLSGMAFFVLTFYIFSYNPAKVKWRPVIWGLGIQIIFALLILRTTVGYEAFKWLGDRVSEFLDYTDAGSKFVFGDNFIDHYFAFKVLPVVVFFSTVVAMLYYLGVMQVLIRIIGKFLAFCLGTSPTESINAAANIFIGQTEAPLMIRPFLKDMTNSEIHAVMTGGFATIAGGVMAAFITNGVPANHLISASVMSAPAALALSKLFYPETKKTKIQAKDVYRLAKGTDRNLIEAATNGASMSISLVANIAVNLIAFMALIAFVNATLVWFGDRVGYDDLTFQTICSYAFWPLAYMMGVEKDDCRTVAEMVGIKTIVNEFVAYSELAKYIHNRESFTNYLFNATKNITGNLTGYWYHKDGGIFLNDTGQFLTEGLISDRSVVIATYALCGFSNLSSMGIQLGALGAMAPTRKGDLSRIVFRAMLAGNAACFMTASIAGLLYEGQ